MTSLRNSLINLSLWWRALGQAAAAATCRVAVLITIKTFWILIQTTILTRAGLFLISCLTSPWLAPALGPVIGKWRKTWPRSRAFMFNFHYWHRVSCEDNNFHNQGPELSGGHGKTEAHYYYYPHKKSHGWTKIRRDKNPSEYLIQWNV